MPDIRQPGRKTARKPPETRNQKPETRNQKPETKKPRNRLQKPQTPNPKLQTPNSKPQTPNSRQLPAISYLAPMSELYTIIWIGITLLLIAFFAGYEIAFVTGNRLSIELKKKQGRSSGLILSRFLEHPAKFIGTCLVGLNIFLVIYGLLFHDLLKKIVWNPCSFRTNT
jgi:hypothetical protein